MDSEQLGVYPAFSYLPLSNLVLVCNRWCQAFLQATEGCSRVIGMAPECPRKGAAVCVVIFHPQLPGSSGTAELQWECYLTWAPLLSEEL